MSLLQQTPIRVLLLDKSKDNQLLMTSLLDQSRYAVEFVETCGAAFERIRLRSYDFVLIDFEGDWEERLRLARQIRQWELQNGRKPMPLLALTLPGSSWLAAEIKESGCTTVLTKPVAKTQLLEALDACQKPLSDRPGMKPAAANIPAAIAALAPKYLSDRRKDLLALRSALDQSDFDAIKRVGHNLKGTGAPYGFPKITEIGTSLETAGKQKDSAEAELYIGHLGDYLDSVKA